MAALKPNEWEVLDFDYITEDKHYKTVVTKYTKTGVVDHNMNREVRLPFKPRVGQILSIPRLH